mmetsp:Transcript_22773/g.46301  ORF Transcript_22773/g.46301 Transcript_22773/m.46301 type:complete len:95 (+) Transcript_22773:150-434(+)
MNKTFYTSRIDSRNITINQNTLLHCFAFDKINLIVCGVTKNIRPETIMLYSHLFRFFLLWKWPFTVTAHHFPQFFFNSARGFWLGNHTVHARAQ